MAHFADWRRLLLLAAVVVLAGCTSAADPSDVSDVDVPEQESADEVVNPATTTTSVSAEIVEDEIAYLPWWPVALTPDGRSMLAFSDADDCLIRQDFEVDITAEEVRITVKQSPLSRSVCDDEGRSSPLDAFYVRLAAPLGSRALVGCQRDDCLSEFSGGREIPVLGNDQYVLRPSVSVTKIYDESSPPTEIFDASSGERIGEVQGAWSSPFTDYWNAGLAGDLLVSANTDSRVVTANDLATGEVVWARQGSFINADEELVLVGRSRIGALDAATGESLWSVDDVSVDAQTAMFSESVMAFDSSRDGGSRLFVVDRASGAVRTTYELDPGFDDILEFSDGVVAVSRTQAVVFDTAGNEISRTGGELGPRLSSADDIGIVSDSISSALGDRTSRGGWRRANEAAGLDSSEAVVLTEGAVALVDGNTGEEMWSTSIGSALPMTAALTEDHVFVSTLLFVASLDRATGEMLWWTEVEPDPDAEVVTEN